MSQVRPVSVARLRALDRFVILVFVSLARLMVRSSPTVLRTRLARLCRGYGLAHILRFRKCGMRFCLPVLYAEDLMRV